MGTDKVAFAGEQWEATGSDVLGSHVTFPLTFSPYFHVLVFRSFFPVLFSRIFIFFVLFSRSFFPYFFLSSSTKCWLRCSLWRPRPITFYELVLLLVIYPLLFSYIRCSLRRPRPITIGSYPSLFSYIIVYIYIYICCVVLQGCPCPITFYELALSLVICPFPAILFS
jgi:hypothetical protein